MSRRTRSGVNTGWTPGPVRRVVENDEFTAFCRRVLRATGRRIAAGDIDALPALAALAIDLDTALGDAVTGLRRSGYSWAEIAARLGVTRQAAHHRWATTTPNTHDTGTPHDTGTTDEED